MATPTHVTVIGAGPGGYPAAFLAADLGMQVTLIDEEKNPGGVCVYRGCIPSKALLHVAKVLDEARHASQFGVEFAAPRVDLDKLRAFKDGVVAKMTGGTGVLTRSRKIRYVQGRATIVDPTDVSVALTGGGEETITLRRRHPRHRLAAGDAAEPVDQRRSRARLDHRARPEERAEVAAGDRRRLHRPRARLGLRRARHARCRSSRCCRACCPAPIAISSRSSPSASARSARP